MTPTPKLRFVQRKEEDWPVDCQYPTVRNVKILQQWWAVERAGQITPQGEWKDVPCERE